MENDFKYYRNSQMKAVSLRSRERKEEITNNTKPVLKIEKENGVRGTVATVTKHHCATIFPFPSSNVNATKRYL